MSRSWIQTVLGRVRRWTLGVCGYTRVRSCALVRPVWAFKAPLSVETQTYGGVFDTDQTVAHTTDLSIEAQAFETQTQWPQHVTACPVAFTAPPVALGTFDMDDMLAHSHTVTAQITGHLGPLPLGMMLEPPRTERLGIPDLPPPPARKKMAIPPLQFSPKHSKVPCTLKVKGHKKAAHSIQIPFIRTPSAFGDYPLAMRKAFRSRLAEKANLPAVEVTVKGIYDRLYLGMFQTLRHGEAGELICEPRPTAQIPNSAVATVPMYLVVGHVADKPNQLLQTVIPMKDLETEANTREP